MATVKEKSGIREYSFNSAKVRIDYADLEFETVTNFKKQEGIQGFTEEGILSLDTSMLSGMTDEMALRFGYKSKYFAIAEHEALHFFICEALGMRTSPNQLALALEQANPSLARKHNMIISDDERLTEEIVVVGFQLVLNQTPKKVLFDHIVFDHAIRTAREYINSRQYVHTQTDPQETAVSYAVLLNQAREIFRPYSSRLVREAVTRSCVSPYTDRRY